MTGAAGVGLININDSLLKFVLSYLNYHLFHPIEPKSAQKIAVDKTLEPKKSKKLLDPLN